MEKHNHFFTPDQVDEQIEQPIGPWPVTPEARYLAEMQRVTQQIRAEDGYSLQRVGERLRHYSMTRAAIVREEQRRSAFSQKRSQGSFHSMNKEPSSHIGRRASLLVALLVMALLVGSLVVTLNFVRVSTPISSPTQLSLHEGDVVSTVQTADSDFTPLAWSPDSQRIAAGATDHVQIWDATTGKHRLSIACNASVRALAWSPNGHFLAIGGAGERTMLQIIDPNTGVIVREFASPISFARPSPSPYLSAMIPLSGGPIPVASIAWSPDGSLIAGAVGTAVVVWNASTGAVVHTFRNQSGGLIGSISWSPDGKHLADSFMPSDEKSFTVVSFHITVQVWNAQTGQVIFNHSFSDNHEPGGVSVAWAHHGMTLAFISDSHTTQIWNVATNTMVARYTTPQAGPFSWSGNNREIASINGRNVDIWDAHTGVLVYRFTKQGNDLSALAWSPNGAYIVSSDATEHSTEAKVWVA